MSAFQECHGAHGAERSEGTLDGDEHGGTVFMGADPRVHASDLGVHARPIQLFALERINKRRAKGSGCMHRGPAS